MKRIIILSALLLSANCAFGASNFSYQQNATNTGFQPNYYAEDSYKLNNNTLKGSVVTVPAGQSFKAVLMAPVSSETAYNGQAITLALNSDFYFNGKRIAPAGSSVTGTVIEVSKAKHGTLNGKLTLRFTQIITPSGQTIPISAVVKTDDNTGTLVGGTKFDIGAALMTAVGAGGGLVKSIWDKGTDVTIPANAGIELILTQPITVNPASSEN